MKSCRPGRRIKKDKTNKEKSIKEDEERMPEGVVNAPLACTLSEFLYHLQVIPDQSCMGIQFLCANLLPLSQVMQLQSDGPLFQTPLLITG